MTVQVLVSTMHQDGHGLLEKMKIFTDAVVVNQCDKNEIEIFEYQGHTIKWISTTDRGVGKSRNLAILNSSADILLFADDDVCYTENYENILLEEFSKTKAELIVFNLESQNKNRPESIVKKKYKLKWHNCLKFGAFRIAIRRESLLKKNIWFSLLFGGGAKFQAGEDNLFITECVHKKVKGIASCKHIGTVEQKESTWFNGFNDKYYHDRGCLFFAMYGRKASIVLLLMEIKKRQKGLIKRYKIGLQGIREFRKKQYEKSTNNFK